MRDNIWSSHQTQRLSNMTERQTGTQREKNMILNCQCLEIKRIVNMMIIQVIWMAVRMITPLTLWYQERQL